MKINFPFVMAAITMLFLPACVSTKKYQALQTDYASLQSSIDAIKIDRDDARSNLAAAKVKIEGLESRLRAEESHVQSLQAALDKCLTTAGQGNVNISTPEITFRMKKHL